MICKWCGATIDVSKGKCSVCGRDIPALSDCGGFYDVVPKATRPAVPQCAQEPLEKPLDKPKENEKAASQPATKHQKQNIRAVLPIVSLALILIFGLFAAVQSISLNERITALESQRDSSSSSIEQLQRDNDSALAQIADLKEQLAAEPTTQEYIEPKLSEMDISFCVMPLENDSYISSNLQNQGTLEYLTSGTDQKAATCYLDGKRLWEAKLSEVPSGKGFNREKTFCFSYDVDSGQLGQYQSATFTWWYRSASAAKWIELKGSDDILIKTDLASSTSTITITDPWLWGTITDDVCEIKCTMERHSKDGGTLIIDFGSIEIQE